MSGQQDRWDELDESHQLDPREATLDLSRLIERMQQPRPVGNGSGSGKHAARSSQAAGSPTKGAELTVATNGAGADHDTGSSDGTGPVNGSGGAARARRAAAGSLTDSDADDHEARAAHASRGSRSAPEPAATPEPAAAPEASTTPAKTSVAPAEASAASPGTASAEASVAPTDTTPAETSATPAGPSVRPPQPGSLADLRQRLEHLPLGHPSSPYHVDGERKPQPPRLKHLELAPAGRDQPSDPLRSAVSAGPVPVHDTAPTTHDTAPTTHDPAPTTHDPAPTTHDPAPTARESAPAAYDTAPTAYDTTPAARAHDPAPAAYDTPPTAHDTAPAAYDTAPTADRRAPGHNPAPTAGHRHAPGYDDATLSHRPTGRRGIPEQPADTDIPRLTQPQLRIAEDVYDRFRALEGRSIFGSYTEGGLTARMREVERQLAHGCLAPDTDQRALLGPEAFKARLADQIWRYPDRAVDLLARGVPGALSYTFIFDSDHYAAGTWLVQETLQGRRFQLLARKNSWNNPEHKRVVTMWHDQESGLRFEVQFHTHASLEAQHLARASADLIANPRMPRAEAQTMRSDLAATWAALPAPPGNAQIGDYRRPPNGPPRP